MRENLTARRSKHLLVVLAVVTAGIAALPAAAAANDCDPAHVGVTGADVRVSPTGVDDTANLQCALDLAASMDRGRVSLSAGTYATSFIDVVGLNGVLRGAGMDATRVETLEQGLDCVTRVAEIGFPHLVLFAGGDVTVNDLTIGIGGETACAEPWDEFVDDGFGFVDSSVDALAFRPGIPVAGECLPEGEQTATVDNVRFDGSSPNYEGPVTAYTHILQGVIAGGFFICPETRSFGDVTVTDSEFLGTDVGIGAGLIDESSIQIANNDFVEVGAAVNSWSHSDTTLDIRNNTVLAKLAGFAFGASPAFVLNTHSVTVRDNDVDGVLFADGMAVLDFAAGVLGDGFIDATFTRNDISLDTEYGGITLVETVGATVHGNDFDGGGSAAIQLFGGRDSSIVRNVVDGFAADVAQIWLAGSTNTFVRCATPVDTVLDEGTGNTVVGCSLLELAVAAADSAAANAFPSSTGTYAGWSAWRLAATLER